MTGPMLAVEGLAKSYRASRGTVRAFEDVSFAVAAGETVALVGESGCGKTSLAKTIYRLQDADAGSVRLAGTDITRLSRRALRPHRRLMQMVFQDPYASLNPRLTVGRILEEPLIVHGIGDRAGRQGQVRRALERVGLAAAAAERHPHQFSGGQRQRIGLARALMLEPGVLLCDEPVSALDVSVQAQVLNLLAGVQEERRLAMLFISHDLGVVRHMADRVLVMYLGRIVESGPARRIFARPAHPYTRALLAAAPVPDPDVEAARPREILQGDPPSPIDPPPGCGFHPRCAFAEARCRTERPPLRTVGDRRVACHRATGDDEASLRLPFAPQPH
ncbi:MAG: ATP-binding cassette domain-containing protein [Alphaproteobacteria bacterium]|nr:ATP-binding cassette domain-containing protein [Alphaproteobacteria bacterium]